MAYEVLGVNDERYVDKSIKLMEKVPELLIKTGFFRELATVFGYKIAFSITKTKNIAPILPNAYLKKG